MATIAAQNLTLLDWANQLEPNGGVTTAIVEMLRQTNEMLLDMTWMEANGATSHRSIIRTGLPAPTWRAFYGGVQPTKSTTAPVEEGMGMLEARSEVDKDLAELNGDVAQFRTNESAAFIEGMNQELQQTLLYGSVASSPKEFNGFAPRFSDKTNAASKENIVEGGGTGTDNTSIWLVVWGPNTVHGIFPKGSKAGLDRIDYGVDPNCIAADGGKFEAYVDLYKLKGGLHVKDWRYVVRIANIDVSNLVGESSAADILKLMTKAVHKIPSMGMGRAAFYANSTVQTMLDIQAQSKSNVWLTVGEEEGRPKVSFRGIPIRRVDQILNTEARVV